MDILSTVRISMWLVATFAATGTVLIGLILAYHWIKYSGNAHVAKLSIIAYSCVSLAILLFLFGSIPA